ncbi:MAG: ABC transporter ATP-binding protein [Atopobiaceae bacterium]|nr:ABC transporter ATP-binding protein [Atopobiaceae bacterium]
MQDAPLSQDKPILAIRDLHLEFHDHGRPEVVVEDLSFELRRAEILGIVGESGSGKSMTALAIAGLLNRHALDCSGTILFDGVDLLHCGRATLRRYQGDEISMIFQEPMTSLDPLQRIGMQVEEALRIHRAELSAAERRKMAIRAMAAAGLPDPEQVYGMYPHELSGGMRQRVMIAAATVLKPQILIADEPTTALDVTTQAQIIALLRTINAEDQTAIVFISHDLSLVRQLCHRVIVMRKGVAVESGASDEVFRNPRHPYTKALVDAIPKVVLER